MKTRPQIRYFVHEDKTTDRLFCSDIYIFLNVRTNLSHHHEIFNQIQVLLPSFFPAKEIDLYYYVAVNSDTARDSAACEERPKH